MRAALVVSLAVIAGCSTAAPVDAPAPLRVADTPACEAVTEWDEQATIFEADLVNILNSERERGGRCGDMTFAPQQPLVMHPALRCAGRLHAMSMRDDNYVDYKHPAPPEGVEELSVLQWLADAEYEPAVYAQNIGAGWPSAREAADAWLASEPHCWKFMTAEMLHVGVGVAITPEDETGQVPEDSYTNYWSVVIAAPE